MQQSESSPAPKREKSIWPMFAGALLLFVLFAAAVQWMISATDRAAFDEEAIRAKQRYEILAKVNEANTALVTGYAWADQAKGTVRIPIDRAMELAVAKLAAQGEPKPANPIDPAAALGAALKPGGLSAPQPTPPPFDAPQAAPQSAEVATPAVQVPAPSDSPAAPTVEVGP